MSVDAARTEARLVDWAFRDLKGQPLAGARIVLSDLTRAELSGTSLAGAYLRHVDLSGAILRDVDARSAHFERCSLRDADLSGADLSLATFAGCDLDGARLAGASLRGVTTVGSSFEGAELESARDLATAREAVVALLARRARPGDLTSALLLGAASLRREWCYAEWVQILRDHPRHARELAAALDGLQATGIPAAFEAAGFAPAVG